ncbi:hypothetical protein Droror1_Dr00027153 [Drosera rotundifolia]
MPAMPGLQPMLLAARPWAHVALSPAFVPCCSLLGVSSLPGVTSAAQRSLHCSAFPPLPALPLVPRPSLGCPA